MSEVQCMERESKKRKSVQCWRERAEERQRNTEGSRQEKEKGVRAVRHYVRVKKRCVYAKRGKGQAGV